MNKKEIEKLANDLFTHPELGYKEVQTKKYLVDYLTSHGFEIENECFNTAFSVSIGKGHPHIGLIAELDAIPTLGHPYANKKDNNAAHACGHSSQCVDMAAVMVNLKEKKFKGKVTLFFTPAEEYTDIKYREKLIKEKKINYIGGKINMLEKGMFDDVDIVIHIHAMSEGKYKYSVGSSLAGFEYKKIIFKGKAAHAAVAPHLGINALNAYALFNDALNMLRETFKEEDCIRVHGFISEGGQTVNSIPERVVYECYVRAKTQSSLLEVSHKVDNAAKNCAKALGARAIVKTSPGYLPFVADEEISKSFLNEILKHVKADEIELNSYSIASGDLGDISVFKPSVQIGYGGFVGAPHSKKFMVKDFDIVYYKTIEIVTNTVCELLNDPKKIKKIVNDFKPRMSKKDYLKYINTR